MTNEEAKPPRGRPKKASGDRRENVTFRMSGSVRDKLTAAAEQGGRSLSEEVEKRVLDSLERERQERALGPFVGSQELLLLVRGVALIQQILDSVGIAKKGSIESVYATRRAIEQYAHYFFGKYRELSVEDFIKPDMEPIIRANAAANKLFCEITGMQQGLTLADLANPSIRAPLPTWDAVLSEPKGAPDSSYGEAILADILARTDAKQDASQMQPLEPPQQPEKAAPQRKRSPTRKLKGPVGRP